MPRRKRRQAARGRPPKARRSLAMGGTDIETDVTRQASQHARISDPGTHPTRTSSIFDGPERSAKNYEQVGPDGPHVREPSAREHLKRLSSVRGRTRQQAAGIDSFVGPAGSSWARRPTWIMKQHAGADQQSERTVADDMPGSAGGSPSRLREAERHATDNCRSGSDTAALLRWALAVECGPRHQPVGPTTSTLWRLRRRRDPARSSVAPVVIAASCPTLYRPGPPLSSAASA